MELMILMSVLVSCTIGDSGVPSDHFLHNSLRHFETIHKDDLSHKVLHQNSFSGYHLRLIKFNSLGRNFHLHLTPHQGLFADDFVAYHVDRHGNMTLYEVDKNQFYSGRMLGETRSSVAVHVSDSGVLTGTVATDTEVYYFEPSRRFISTPHSYHMIAYRQSDVNFQFSNRTMDYQYAPAITDEDNNKQPMGKVVQDSITGHRHGNHRLRRALGGFTCRMYLVADTYFYNRIGNNHVGDSIIFMVSIIAAVDANIYRNTVFNLSNGTAVTALGIQAAAAMVHTEFNDNLDLFPYNRDDNADSNEVLNRFSTLPSTDRPAMEPQQDRYCLAHLFTFRPFSQNRLGLANIASSQLGTTGGICSRVVIFSGVRRIFNTGVSTFIIGERVLMRVEGQLVVAHEIGHNWGSMHDTGQCNNNYLMNEFAQTGEDSNNFLFSACSRDMISDALSSKGDCFTNDPQNKCGNFFVEDGEQCDTGLNSNDTCCDDRCMFNTAMDAVCSDLNSECCTNCSAADMSTLCHSVTDLAISTDCTANTYCNGINFTCPQLKFLSEGTRCIFGECRAANGTTSCTSFCVARGLTPCSCQGPDACRVCCQGDNQLCMPLESITEFLSDGVPCIIDGVNGACINGTCMEGFQEDGTIRRFLRFIQNLSVDSIVRAIEENIVGFILICTLIVWLPVSLLIHCCVDRKLYNRFLEHLREHEDEKEKINRMSRRKPMERTPRLNLSADSFFSGRQPQPEE